MRVRGQYLTTATPMTESQETGPKYRESAEFSRLSPITHTHPSGTV